MTIFLQRNVYNSFMNTIFLDELFLLNTSLDYLALLCTCVLSGGKIRRIRLLWAAVFGGIYACLSVLPDFSWLLDGAVKLCAGVGVCLMAFWSERHFWVCCGLFFLLSAAFGGMLTAFGWQTLNGFYLPIAPQVLLLTFFLAYFLLHLLYAHLPKAHKQDYAQIVITCGDRSVQLCGLHDSGNELLDPLTGLPVLVCEPELVGRLLPHCAELLRSGDPLHMVECSTRTPMHLICCTTVSGPGLLAGFRPDCVTINGKREEFCIAVAASAFSPGSPYSAIY